MKRSGCFVAGGLVLVAGCILSLVIAVEFLRRRTEALEEELGPQPATELVRVASLPPGSSLTIGDGQIEMVAFSPDGQTLVTATTRGLVFYDTAATRPRLSVPVNFGADELAWSPDGQALAVASGDVSLSLYEPATGRQTLVLDVRDALVSNLAWSPDGRYLAATVLGMYREDVWIWDAQTGERLFELPDSSRFGSSYARAISWSPLDFRLAVTSHLTGLGEPTGGRDEIRIWQIGREPELISEWPLDDGRADQLTWTRDGLSLIALTYTGLRTFDSQSGAILAQTDGDLRLSRFALSPDGRTLAAGGESDGTITFYDALTLEHIGQIQTPLFTADSLSWSADGAGVAATMARTDRFQVWSWPDGRLLADVSTASPASKNVAWSPDSRLLAVRAWPGLTYIYDGETGERLLTIGEEQYGEVPQVAWSFDGRLLATTRVEQTEDGREFTTLIWSPDGELQATIAGDLIAWASRSNRLLVASPSPYNEYAVQTWDVAAEGQPAKTSEFKTRMGRWAWSPDDSLIAGVDKQWDSSDSFHSKIVVLELESQSPVAELTTTDMSYVRSMAWSPDGAWLAASYDYNCPRQCARLEIWDTATWQSHKTFGRLDSSSGSLSWSPDSRWIVAPDSPTGSAITLYPLDDQQPIRELDHHLGLDAVAAWSPDGRRIASTNYDGQLTIWDAAALLPPTE